LQRTTILPPIQKVQVNGQNPWNRLHGCNHLRLGYRLAKGALLKGKGLEQGLANYGLYLIGLVLGAMHDPGFNNKENRLKGGNLHLLKGIASPVEAVHQVSIEPRLK
jgi:hypothetical protein